MNKTRVIPVLLLKGKGLVKTVRFKKPKYIGDPINSVRIFNEKEVDELVFLDIAATPEGRGPDFDLLTDIASEAFMPMAYGGGISSLSQIQNVFALGFEKVIIDSHAYCSTELIRDAVSIYGSQSIVGCIDVKRAMFSRFKIYSNSGMTRQRINLVRHLTFLENLGIGELIVNSVDRDGTFSGYDLNLLDLVTSTVSIPVVALGGASSIDDFNSAITHCGVSAVAAGSMFVFVGPHKAVLINYPDRADLAKLLP